MPWEKKRRGGRLLNDREKGWLGLRQGGGFIQIPAQLSFSDNGGAWELDGMST